MPTATASLTIGPDIQIYTPTSGTRFLDRASSDKRVAALALLSSVTVAPWPTILGAWESFSATVDSSYEDTVPTMQSLIQAKFNAENTGLLAALGYNISIGEACASWPRPKKPDCTSITRHCFKIYKVISGVTSQWIETYDGVQGPMIATIEWTSPAA